MRKAEKRAEICKTATKLFVKKGFEKTTIRDIAREAGINSASIYYYFEDKESVLYEILIEIMDRSLDQLREIVNHEISLREKIYAIIRMHTEIYGLDTISMELIVHNQKSISPEHWDELKSKQKEYAKIVAGILSELKKEGKIIDIDPMGCTFSLFGMIQTSYRWYKPDGPINPNQLSDMFIQIFTKGVFYD